MTRTVLLTGATGFVGRQIMRALDRHGVRMRVVVRESGRRPFVWHSTVAEVVTTSDLFAEDPSWWARTCDGIDTVVHAAWYAEPGQYLHSSKNVDCLRGTLNLAAGAVEARVRRFVGVGTCFEYDVAAEQLSVETPLKPATLYAATKTSAYLTLSQWLPPAGLQFAWARLFYLHGEGEDLRRLVPYLRSRLSAGEPADLTSGTQVRDFIDVAEAGRMIAETALGVHEGALNVCSGLPITVRQLAEQIADEYGRRDLLRFGARPDNAHDPARVVGVRHEGPL